MEVRVILPYCFEALFNVGFRLWNVKIISWEELSRCGLKRELSTPLPEFQIQLPVPFPQLHASSEMPS